MDDHDAVARQQTRDRRAEDEPSSVLHLSAAGVSLLLELAETRLPTVLYWGQALGDLADVSPESVLAAFGGPSDGSLSIRLRGSRAAADSFTAVRTHLISQTPLPSGLTSAGADILVVEAEDPTGLVSVDLALQLLPTGLVRGRVGITNRSADSYRLDGLELMLPISESATQRVEIGSRVTSSPLGPGSVVVERTAGIPAYLTVAEEGASFRSGQLWQSHVAFGGAVQHRVVRTAAGGTLLGGGESLRAGEISLPRGDSYHSPWIFWNWADGLDAAAARMHAYLRRDPVTRPVIFDAATPAFADHDHEAMLTLAEYAAAVGVETFLLDLDWCARHGLNPHGDSDSRNGAGAPSDLDGLLARIRELDLEVGLAVDPQLIDAGSAIAGQRPEWSMIIEVAGERRQALDLSVRAATGYAWERLTKLFDRHQVSLLSWSLGPSAEPASANVHASTLAGYRLLDALRERYPQIAVQTPMLDLAGATRASGTHLAADSVARQTGFGSLIQLLPPALIWQPVIDEPDDGLSPAFRAASAFFGQLGLGLDLRKQQPASLRSIHRWLSLHKQFRPLLHSGAVVRLEPGTAELQALGVVADDHDQALFAVTWLDRSSRPWRLRIDGLDQQVAYRVTVVGPRSSDAHAVVPPWSVGPALVLTGQTLQAAGLPLPPARRGSALLLHFEAVREAD